MRDASPSDPRQQLNISEGASLENVQIGGIAGRDLNLTQIQYVTVTDPIDPSLIVGHTPLQTIRPLTQQEYRQRQVLLNKVLVHSLVPCLMGCLVE